MAATKETMTPEGAQAEVGAAVRAALEAAAAGLPAIDPALLEPIAGVSLAAYAELRRELEALPDPEAHSARVAGAELDPATWAEADAGWRSRMNVTTAPDPAAAAGVQIRFQLARAGGARR
jgi:hypothetical protein